MSWEIIMSWQNLTIAAVVIMSLKLLSTFIKWKKANRLRLPNMSNVSFSWLNKEWIHTLGFILLFLVIIGVTLTQLDIPALNKGAYKLWNEKRLLLVTSIFGLICAMVLSFTKVKVVDAHKGFKKLMTSVLCIISIAGLVWGSGILDPIVGRLKTTDATTINVESGPPTSTPVVVYAQPVEAIPLGVATQAGVWSEAVRNPYNKFTCRSPVSLTHYKVRVNKSERLIYEKKPGEVLNIPPSVSVNTLEFLTPKDSYIEIIEK